MAPQLPVAQERVEHPRRDRRELHHAARHGGRQRRRFSVTVSNAKGSVTSADAILTVNLAAPTPQAFFKRGTSDLPRRHYRVSPEPVWWHFLRQPGRPVGANFNLYLYKWSGSAWDHRRQVRGSRRHGVTQLSRQGWLLHLEVRAVTGSGNYSLSYVLAK